MKKTIAILLALCLCIGLCACGGGEEVETLPVESAQGTTAPKVTQIALLPDEKLEIGEFVLSFQEVLFADEMGRVSCGDDEIFLCVQYTIEYLGKSETYASSKLLTVIYGDGYSFETDDVTFKDASDDEDDYAVNGNVLKPMCEPKNCKAHFTLPRKVLDEQDAMYVLINTAELGDTEEKQVTFNIYPNSEEEKAALYEKTVSSFDSYDESSIYTPLTFFKVLEDYKDSADWLKKAENTQRLYKFSYNTEYFNEHMSEYQVMTGEEIAEIIVGDRYGFGTGRVWNIRADGTIDDGFNYYKVLPGFQRNWSVEGDTLYITAVSSGQVVKHGYTVVKVQDNGYLLVADGEIDDPYKDTYFIVK